MVRSVRPFIVTLFVGDVSLVIRQHTMAVWLRVGI